MKEESFKIRAAIYISSLAILIISMLSPSSSLALENAVFKPDTIELVMGEVANFETPSSDNLTVLFKELGYIPRSPTIWASFPAVRKLTELYTSAEASVKGDGNRVLAAVAKRFAERFDSFKNNPQVKQFILNYDKSPGEFTFDLNAKLTISAIGIDTREAIEALTGYVESGRLGGGFRILTNVFGLTRDEAYEILATSDTTKQALVKGVASIPLNEQVEKIAILVSSAKKAYTSFGKSPGYLAFIAAAMAVVGDPMDPNVECLCGGRPIGIMPKSMCHVGMPCK